MPINKIQISKSKIVDMTTYPIPIDEKVRLSELLSYQILDSPVESEFENIVSIVARTFNVPVAAISFIDTDRQWVKAHKGMASCNINRGESVCNYTILQNGVLEVEDLKGDERFSHFPGICTAPFYRYYAGVPLVTKRGYNIGVLCIVDDKVRRLDKDDYHTLLAFARSIVTQLEIRLQNLELRNRNDIQKRISCALSHDIRGPLANVKMLLNMQEEMVGEVDDADGREMNKLINNEVDNTMSILNNMIQWGQLQLNAEDHDTRFNLRQLANEVLNEVYNSNCTKYNMLINAVPDNIIVDAEYQGVRFVLRNLLTNAGKFTQNGCITVSYEKQDGRNIIHIKDSGVGMTPETTARLNRKQKVDHTIGTNNEVGHGLGLSLVQEYLAKQDKELYFQSIMGIGTIASFIV